MQLSIELKSALCVGSGIGRPGYVDRDVIFDRAGLPYIPGRRLKGLLRDSYRQVLQTPLAGDLPPLETLFGIAGRRTGEISVADAHLPDADRLRPWLLEVYRTSPQTLRREDVIAAFTEIRRQTAMSRHTGAPEENTLRATRVIRSRLQFIAEISGVSDTSRQAVEYASQALQFMGTSRTRGLGWVQCTLADREVASRASSPATDTRMVCKSQQDALAFSLTLESATVFPSQSGDANTVLSHPFIPGSTVLGLFARRYLREHGLSEADDHFYELFCAGKLKFLSANLEIADAESRRRSTPVPHSVRTLKRNPRQCLNLALADPKEPLRRAAGWAVLEEVCRGKGVVAEPATELHYHHARTTDPRYGRALGERAAEVGLDPDEDAGALFTYESLTAGQRFLGEILGPPELLAEVRELIADDDKVRLGRSRSAQYGADGRWRWESAAQTCAVNRGTTNSHLLVTLLSPVLSLNRWGHPVAEFPDDQLAQVLGENVRLTLTQAFTRTHWQRGYLSHQGLPRLQVPALAAGSVLIYKVETAGDLSALSERLSSASAQSYGLRQEEGFGRIDVRWKSSISDQPALHRYIELTKNRLPRAVPDSADWKLARKILRERLIAAADAAGTAKADRVEDIDKISPHLLHRLLSIFAKTPVEQIETVLAKQLAEKPRRLLERCLIRDIQGVDDLRTFLSRPWQTLWTDFMNVYDGPRTGWVNLLEVNPFATAADQPANHEDGRFARALAKRYLRSFLTAIAWRKKVMERRALPAAKGDKV